MEQHKEQQKEHCTCLKCKAKLEVRNTYARKVKQKSYFTVLTKCGEYQTLRMFLLVVEMEKGCKAAPYALEIGQYWWNAKGKQTLVAIQRILGRYVDTFSFGSPMAIRGDNGVYRHIATFDTCPRYSVIDTLQRNGFRSDLQGIEPAKLIPALLANPKVETLMKAGQYDLLRHCLHSSTHLEDYWPSVKICIRNGYTHTRWLNVVRPPSTCCGEWARDTHSPKYVCPADLKAEHDKLVEQRNRKEERERLALQRKEAAQYEKDYLLQKGKFFGIVITDGTLNVRVLESVAEIAEEGTLMHHCVYANAYYRKENSLILSATIGSKRIETVEVDLKEIVCRAEPWRVQQQHGVPRPHRQPCEQQYEFD